MEIITEFSGIMSVIDNENDKLIYDVVLLFPQKDENARKVLRVYASMLPETDGRKVVLTQYLNEIEKRITSMKDMEKWKR